MIKLNSIINGISESNTDATPEIVIPPKTIKINLEKLDFEIRVVLNPNESVHVTFHSSNDRLVSFADELTDCIYMSTTLSTMNAIFDTDEVVQYNIPTLIIAVLVAKYTFTNRISSELLMCESVTSELVSNGFNIGVDYLLDKITLDNFHSLVKATTKCKSIIAPVELINIHNSLIYTTRLVQTTLNGCLLASRTLDRTNLYYNMLTLCQDQSARVNREIRNLCGYGSIASFDGINAAEQLPDRLINKIEFNGLEVNLELRTPIEIETVQRGATVHSIIDKNMIRIRPIKSIKLIFNTSSVFPTVYAYSDTECKIPAVHPNVDSCGKVCLGELRNADLSEDSIDLQTFCAMMTNMNMNSAYFGDVNHQRIFNIDETDVKKLLSEYDFLKPIVSI